MNREILFPTPVYFKMVENPQKMNNYLFPLIKAWSKKDKSEEKTNAQPFGAVFLHIREVFLVF